MLHYRGRGRDRGVRNAVSRKNRVSLGERNDLAPSETYMLPDIFRYSITATRGIARRARRKNVINRSLVGRDILRARV